MSNDLLVILCWARKVGYALAPMICTEVMLGAAQLVILHMSDIPSATEAFNGVKMGLLDA
jgi:hypothetical protein